MASGGDGNRSLQQSHRAISWCCESLRIVHEDLTKRIGAYSSTVRRSLNDTLAYLKRQRQEQRETCHSQQCQGYSKMMAYRFGLPTFPCPLTIENNRVLVPLLPDITNDQDAERVPVVGKAETETVDLSKVKVASFQTESFKPKAKLAPPQLLYLTMCGIVTGIFFFRASEGSAFR
jgi:hypothetical protein